MLQIARKFKKNQPEEKRTIQFWDTETGEYLGKIVLSETNTSSEVKMNFDLIQRIGISRPDLNRSLDESQRLPEKV